MLICLNAMNLYQLKREFLEHCELEKGQSVLTVSNYERYLDRFLEFLKTEKMNVIPATSLAEPRRKAGIQDSLYGSPRQVGEDDNKATTPDDITQEVVRKYRLYVNRLRDNQGRELKKSTENYHMLALRAFLRYLAWRGIISLSPEKVPVAKSGDREISFLQNAEVEQIIAQTDTSKLSGLRDKAILELLFSTGLRVSELCQLDADDINFERGEISVMGKGKKIRVVFISASALNALDQYLKNRGFRRSAPGTLAKEIDEPLFLSKRDERLTVRSIERIVAKYATKAGITKKVSPHTLRHSFATDLLIAGADIRSVQSMLGHSSITTTQVYTHVTDQHLREIHQKFHGKSIKEEQRVESSQVESRKEEENEN